MATSLMLLTNPYRPDPRVLREARALTEAGHRITLLAWDRETGAGAESKEGGVNVVRLGPKSPFRSPLRVFFGLLRFWARALRKSRGLEFDLVHSHDLDTLPLGIAIARFSGKPLLYDGHELYAAMVKDEVGPLYQALAVLEQRLMRRPDAIITVSEALADALSRRRSQKARIVMTSPDITSIGKAEMERVKAVYGLSGFVICYLGSLEPGRFVEELMDIFGPDDGVTVLIGGAGSLEQRVRETSERASHIRYIGFVNAEEALALTASSDLVSAMMDPSNPNNVIGTPGKILNSMALGKALITADELDIGRLVREIGCGFSVPYKREAFREAVLIAKDDEKALEGMGARGKEYFVANMSWQKSREELLRTYRTLLKPQAGDRQ
ncbi:MAG: glycosyltransferase family 4 protein [Methanobacteriota archaeon]|nr:MAG: glycosyltransferase family 4 protein [Euryarchaeota archaeon]